MSAGFLRRELSGAAVLLLLAPLVACDGGDEMPPLELATEPTVFAGIDAANYPLLVDVATGMTTQVAKQELRRAHLEAAESSGEPRPCPSLQETDGVRYIVGGCTTSSGYRYEGQVRLDNAFLFTDLALGSLPAVRADEPAEILYDAFVVTGPDGQQIAIDGSVWSRAALPDGAQESRAELLVAMDGAPETEVRFRLSCTARHCELLPGSSAAVAGFGRFDVTGGYGLGETAGDRAGFVTLRGVDEMSADFDRGASDCALAAVNGTEVGTVCSEIVARSR